VQVRARNAYDWSDFSQPLLVIDTPPQRQGERAKYNPKIETFGYCKDLKSGAAEEATDWDWDWLFKKYGPDGPFAA